MLIPCTTKIGTNDPELSILLQIALVPNILLEVHLERTSPVMD